MECEKDALRSSFLCISCGLDSAFVQGHGQELIDVDDTVLILIRLVENRPRFVGGASITKGG